MAQDQPIQPIIIETLSKRPRNANFLIKAPCLHPSMGLENQNLSGWRSRRITGEHRLVYRIHEERLVIMMGRYHY